MQFGGDCHVAMVFTITLLERNLWGMVRESHFASRHCDGCVGWFFRCWKAVIFKNNGHVLRKSHVLFTQFHREISCF